MIDVINTYDIEIWVNEPSGETIFNVITIESTKSLEDLTRDYRDVVTMESYVVFVNKYRSMIVPVFNINRMVIKQVID